MDLNEVLDVVSDNDNILLVLFKTMYINKKVLQFLNVTEC